MRSTFDAYKRALQETDGAAAAELVSRSTIAYYEEMVQLAFTAPEEDLRARSTVDQLSVLSLRHQIPREELEGLDGKGAVAAAVDQGLIGDVSQLGIGEIEIDGDEATGRAISEGQDAALARWSFRREDGTWKLDLTALFELSGVGFEQAADQAGMTVEELIFRSLEIATGREVSPDIWEPLAG